MLQNITLYTTFYKHYIFLTFQQPFLEVLPKNAAYVGLMLISLSLNMLTNWVDYTQYLRFAPQFCIYFVPSTYVG